MANFGQPTLPALSPPSSIATRSKSFVEVLENASIDGVEGLKERWCRQVGKGDAWLRRIEWAFPSHTEPVYRAEDWTKAMSELAATMPDIPSTTEFAEDLPFAELFGPIGYWIKTYYQSQWQSIVASLTPSAEPSVLHLLLERLAALAAPAWQQAFSETLPYGLQQLASLGGKAALAYDGDEHYRAFVSAHHGTGMLSLWERFPALARVFFTVLEQSIVAINDTLKDFRRDWPRLAQWGGLGDECPRLLAIHACGSDWHHGSREVMRLEIAGQQSFIYKPRSCALEAAWADALAWLNGELGSDVRAARTLDCGHHGWMEWIVPTACESEDEGTRYYENAGMTLALLWLLRGSDIHYENLIATRCSPVLIDAEALLWRQPTNAAPLTALESRYVNSVLRIGLLPQWRNSGRTAYDVSGLGQSLPDGEMTVRRWLCLGRDTQHFGQTVATPPSPGNVVRLGDRSLSPHDHVPALVKGFRRAATLILQRREFLLGPGSPLQRFHNAPARFIFRATSTYSHLLADSLSPSVLTDGISRGLVLEKLARALLSESEPPPTWPLLDAEIRALSAADIPFFHVHTGDTAVRYSGGRIEGVFSETAWDCLAREFSCWNQELIDLQVRLIETAYAPPPSALLTVEQASGNVDPHLLQARQIADYICGQAIPDTSGVNWVALSVSHDGDCHLAPLPPDWYSGTAGVAGFLALAYTVTGERRYRDTAEAAIAPWLAALDEVGTLGLGLASGLGGLVYALVRFALAFDEERYFGAARKLAISVAPDQIACDVQLDVIGGSAGLLLGLARLVESRPDPVLLDIGRRCVSHLLARSQPQSGGGIAWPTLPNYCVAPLTGFSHGASGIAYALLRWHSIDPQVEIVTAIRQAMDYERSVFSNDAGNWPDFRSRPDGSHAPRYQNAWCHGSPGIALARQTAMEHFDWPELQSDLDMAIAAAMAATHLPSNLCCGDFGVGDILQKSSTILDRPDLAAAASRRIDSALDSLRAGRTGLLPAGVKGTAFNPGLFTGLAGIGYVLLRIARPNAVPCLLSCE